MRQGGIDLERRGPEFEAYCIKQLRGDIQHSPIRAEVQIAPGEVAFNAVDFEEKVDIVIIVGSTVLLVEAKCTLWPEDSLQYANHRRTVLGAVGQVSRQCRAAQAHYGNLSARLTQMGLNPPEQPNIIRAVLTNSAIYAGFDFDGVPVTDLAILGKFFENTLVKFELRQGGEALETHAVSFYESADDAAARLEAYLLAPPQMDNMKQSVVTRRSVLPVDSDEFGKLIYETWSVEIDEAAILARYAH